MASANISRLADAAFSSLIDQRWSHTNRSREALAARCARGLEECQSFGAPSSRRHGVAQGPP